MKAFCTCLALLLTAMGLHAEVPAFPAVETRAGLPKWATAQIKEDLAPFADGISTSDLDVYCRLEDGKVVIDHPTFSQRPEAVQRFQIVDNSIRTMNPAADPVRTQRIVDALKTLSEHIALPDADFVVCLYDGVVPEIEGPIFGCSKPTGIRAILWPDFDMMAGYQGRIDFDAIFQKEPAWEAKKPIAIWRGATIGGTFRLDNWRTLPRSKLVLLSLINPTLLDARFSAVVEEPPEIAEEMAELGMLAPPMAIAEQLRYRYLIAIDANWCAHERIYWALRSHSTLLKVQSNQIQWYDQGLKARVHYMPVSADLTDLCDAITWLRQHEPEAKLMAFTGNKFAQDNLTRSTALRYMFLSLHEYSQLLK